MAAVSMCPTCAQAATIAGSIISSKFFIDNKSLYIQSQFQSHFQQKV
jgi:hypothetical protein